MWTLSSGLEEVKLSEILVFSVAPIQLNPLVPFWNSQEPAARPLRVDLSGLAVRPG